MLKTLDLLSLGETGLIKTITAEGKIRRRLFDMGVTPGTKITLKKLAPMGDPLEVTIRGYELTLRKSEAHFIFVEVE